MSTSSLHWPGRTTSITPAARRWFEASHRQGWATCPLTESGFVRVSSNRRVIPDARRPEEVIGLLRELTSLPGHGFWIDDTSIARSPGIGSERLIGYRQVTDAHLVALTLRRRGRLVTFDRGIAEILPERVRSEAVLTVLDIEQAIIAR